MTLAPRNRAASPEEDDEASADANADGADFAIAESASGETGTAGLVGSVPGGAGSGGAGSAGVQTFDRRMLEALVCPRTQGTLRYDVENQELISPAAQLAFPIRDGIPIMLISAARVLE